MTTPFGPRLIGETEKALGALLDRALDGTGLDEREWVTLRLAHGVTEADGPDGRSALVDIAGVRAHFRDASALVDGLTARGLIEDGRPTPAGRDLATLVQGRIDDITAAIWTDLPEDEVVAATRVLNEIAERARSVLANVT